MKEKELPKELKKMFKEINKTEKEKEKVTKEILTFLKRKYPKNLKRVYDSLYKKMQKNYNKREAKKMAKQFASLPDKRQTAPFVLAKALAYFDIDNHKTSNQLYTQWVIEHFVAHKLLDNMTDIDFIYDYLKKHRNTEKRKLDLEVADRYVFYIPNKKYKVLVWNLQSWNFLIIKGARFVDEEIHIRRFWNQVNKDNLGIYEWEKKKKITIKEAIKHADWLVENLSDNVLKNKYIERPDLNMYKNTNFVIGEKKSCNGLHYADCRDAGYIASCEGSGLTNKKVDNAIGHFSEIGSVTSEIQYTKTSIKEKNK